MADPVVIPEGLQITPQEIRDYLADSPENNHLIDGEEFTDARILIAMKMALSTFNSTPPISIKLQVQQMPADILLYGTLWHLYNGQMALAARNQMSYSDGGLTVPIEERYQFFVQMAQMYENQFTQAIKAYKVSMNMDSGWGEIRTDYATFPIW